jgi:hypothetical protein
MRDDEWITCGEKLDEKAIDKLKKVKNYRKDKGIARSMI